jgi:hypothetical protein
MNARVGGSMVVFGLQLGETPVVAHHIIVNISTIVKQPVVLHYFVFMTGTVYPLAPWFYTIVHWPQYSINNSLLFKENS